MADDVGAIDFRVLLSLDGGCFGIWFVLVECGCICFRCWFVSLICWGFVVVVLLRCVRFACCVLTTVLRSVGFYLLVGLCVLHLGCCLWF